MSFLDEITPLKEAALQALETADTLAKLDDVRVQYLGTNGQFTGLLKQMGGLAKEERPAAGKAVNQVKAELNQTLDQRREQLELVAAAAHEPVRFCKRQLIAWLHLVAGLGGALAVYPRLPGHDSALGLLAALAQPALDQRHVQSRRLGWLGCHLSLLHFGGTGLSLIHI